MSKPMLKQIVKVLLLSVVLLPGVLCAQIYKQKDADGRVSYTDKPAAGETSEEIAAKPIINSLPEVAPAPAATNSNQTKNGEALPDYKSVEIIYPLNEFTLTTGESAALEIKAATVPKVQSNHKLHILLDGVSVGALPGTGTITVNNPERGEHLLTAQIVDENGGVLLQSAPIKIYVQQISVNSPKNPNNPKNKPKPKAP